MRVMFLSSDACLCICSCIALCCPMQCSDFLNAIHCLANDENRAVNEQKVESVDRKTPATTSMVLRVMCVNTFPFGKMLD